MEEQQFALEPNRKENIERILVVGYGGIAKRHIENLGLLGYREKVAVLRKSRKLQTDDDRGKVQRYFFSPEEALSWQPDAAVIASPASHHVEIGAQLASQGAHLFIEKPISDSLEGVESLVEECERRSVALMVGYNFRFYRPFHALRHSLAEGSVGTLTSIRAEVGQFLPEWRPRMNHKLSVSSRSELGGGVILELSHELDYLRWLGGEVTSISCLSQRATNLTHDVEDTAEVLLEFESGALGNLHLDMIDRKRTRRCRLVGTEGTLVWSGEDHTVTLFRSNDGGSSLFQYPHFDVNEMYLEEMQHFLESVTEGRRPLVDGNVGRRVLELVLAAKKSSALGTRVYV